MSLFGFRKFARCVENWPAQVPLGVLSDEFCDISPRQRREVICMEKVHNDIVNTMKSYVYSSVRGAKMLLYI